MTNAQKIAFLASRVMLKPLNMAFVDNNTPVSNQGCVNIQHQTEWKVERAAQMNMHSDGSLCVDWRI